MIIGDFWKLPFTHTKMQKKSKCFQSDLLLYLPACYLYHLWLRSILITHILTTYLSMKFVTLFPSHLSNHNLDSFILILMFQSLLCMITWDIMLIFMISCGLPHFFCMKIIDLFSFVFLAYPSYFSSFKYTISICDVSIHHLFVELHTNMSVFPLVLYIAIALCKYP